MGFLSNRKLTSGYNKNILCRIREVVSITGFVMLWRGKKMITSIKEMHNLGRYENFIGNQEIGKQQIIFGFNGSGKSTLSDMFYSLANKKSISVDRRTLDKN